jgi:Protein of unknown function (DUF2961)
MTETAHARVARSVRARVALGPWLIVGILSCGPSRAPPARDDADTVDVGAETEAGLPTSGDGAADTDAGANAGISSLPPLLAEWPLVRVGVESRQVSSFDRAGGNDDGFSGQDSALYVDATGEQVIFDALGPGRLNTLWFTSPVSGTAPLRLGHIRFYLDDQPQPMLSADADELFAGAVKGFPGSLVWNNLRSTGGFVSWVPVPFARRLKITTETRPAFYSAQYETFPVDTSVVSWTPAAAPDAWAASLMAPIPDTNDGDELPLDTSGASAGPGPGLITKLTFLPARSGTAAELRQARVRIWWEGEPTPSVDCPLDAFFGSGLGETSVQAVPFTMAPGRWENRLPMPFWERFRVQITGLPGRLFLRVTGNPYRVGEAAHLRVIWHEERPTNGADDFEYLSYQGAGRLVATVLTVEPPDAARDKQWWEGDLRSYADGRRTPGVHGTGHEDDHFGGWSNEFFSGPFTLPMHGEPRTQILDHNGQFNGNVAMYRVWTGIPFLREVRHSVEHGTENNRTVNESAATFFYAEPRSWLVDSDTLAVCDDAARATHHLTVAGEARPGVLASAFEGRGYRTPVALCHHTHTGAATFDLAVAADNQGVLLRRTFDQARGRQNALVRVGGRVVGTWYIAEQNPTLRWAERDFFLPKAFTAGGTSLSISIEPAADAPPWDAAEYRSLSVVPPALP